jgi:hypothetical protein
MRGATAPSNPTNRMGHTHSDTPLMYLFDRGGAEKVNTISQTKTSILVLNRAFISQFEASKMGGGLKPSKHAYMK